MSAMEKDVQRRYKHTHTKLVSAQLSTVVATMHDKFVIIKATYEITVSEGTLTQGFTVWLCSCGP